MKNVYVIGIAYTKVKKWKDKSHRDLVREAYLEALKDTGLENGNQVESIYFGSCFLPSWGQDVIRGQVILMPLIMDGSLPSRLPILNVENGCATGAVAFQGAVKDVALGLTHLSLAVGVDKMFIPDNPELTTSQYSRGIDQMNPEEWMAVYQSMAQKLGSKFELSPDRTMFMDTYAMQAQYHMKKYGVTKWQLACAAAKSHNNASLNPKAQYQFKLTPQEAFDDYVVSEPLTRAMCAPIADAAAAVLVCSEEFLRNMPSAVQSRAVRVAATTLSSGYYRDFDEPSLSRIAADKAYAMAGVGPKDMDLCELHDATVFGEIYHSEMLRLCPEGKGGELAESGESSLQGRIPLNTSGGLISKGHPVGATGITMLHELTTQLRGEAGERQVKNAEFGIMENGGGVVGVEEASCVVTILQKI